MAATARLRRPRRVAEAGATVALLQSLRPLASVQSWPAPNRQVSSVPLTPLAVPVTALPCLSRPSRRIWLPLQIVGYPRSDFSPWTKTRRRIFARKKWCLRECRRARYRSRSWVRGYSVVPTGRRPRLLPLPLPLPSPPLTFICDIATSESAAFCGRSGTDMFYYLCQRA